MIALIQRVKRADVRVGDRTTGEIGAGLLALVCAERGDTDAAADKLLAKMLGYRVFSDAAGKMNLPVSNIDGEGRAGGLLLVSQFTLAADTNSGLRPSFTPAAPPDEGARLFDYFVAAARARHPVVETGEFGADMQVSLVNDGPGPSGCKCGPDSSPRRAAMATTQILFIRHGETAWNRIKRIQGHIDIPLAETGLEQAQKLAARLARDARDGARLDAIYSSDLMRAQQTAQPFADALGLAPRLREGLRERSYGQFQGHDSAEIETLFPDAYAAWQTRDPGFAPEGGESQREFYHRVLHALEPIVAEHPGGRIACVAHGGVLDCVYRFANGIELSAPRNYQLLNTSINVVDYVDGRAQVVQWADVSHLDAASDDDGYRKVL